MNDKIKNIIDEATEILAGPKVTLKEIVEENNLQVDPERDKFDRLEIANGFYVYQCRAWETASLSAQDPLYLLPGLAGEVGELEQVFAKALRDKGGMLDEESLDMIQKEIGDCLWFLSGIATLYNLDFGETAWGNIAKLQDRQQRGVISGSGDDR